MIKIDSVSEIYSLKFFRENEISEEAVYALNNVSLNINYGEVINVIGENGSGKSTLLKVISGLIDPKDGFIEVNGKVGLIMDIGCGFHPDLTGRENLLAAASLYGYSKKDIMDMIPQIMDFAGLGKYFDAPVRTYSQGMYLRLAFSFAVNMNPDILCIDDIITVGDELYRQRALSKIDEFKKCNKTIILVTHDLFFARKFATRTIWLKDGRIFFDGCTKKAIEKYLGYLESKGIKKKEEFSNLSIKNVDRSAVIFLKGFELLNLSGLLIKVFDKKQGKTVVLKDFEIIENGNHFVRLLTPENSEKLSFEIITSINRNSFKIEFFAEDFLGLFNDNLDFEIRIPWAPAWSDFFIFDSIYNDLKEKTDFFLCSSFNSLSLKGSFVPSLKKEETNIENKRLLIIRTTTKLADYPLSKKRIMLLEARGSNNMESEQMFNNSLLKDESSRRLSFGETELQFEGMGFCLKRKGQKLFVFNGIEFLFLYRGCECFSNDSDISIKKIDHKERELYLSYYNKRWPLIINFKCHLTSPDSISLSWHFENVLDEPVKNLRFQILFNRNFIEKKDDSVFPDKLCFYTRGRVKEELRVVNASNKKLLWLLDHSYQDNDNASHVVYMLDPFPSSDVSYSLKCCFGKTSEHISSRFINKDIGALTFNQGGIGLKFEGVNILTGWKNYISLNSSPIWHDSLQCIWVEESESVFSGRLPWLPVRIVLHCKEVTNREYKISYSFFCEEECRVEKAEICFPLNKVWDLLSFNVFEMKDESVLNNNLSYGIGAKDINIGFKYGNMKFFIGFMSSVKFIVSLEKSVHSDKTLKFTWHFDEIYFKRGRWHCGDALLKFEQK